jgi:hypothetical protein
MKSRLDFQNTVCSAAQSPKPNPESQFSEFGVTVGGAKSPPKTNNGPNLMAYVALDHSSAYTTNRERD